MKVVLIGVSHWHAPFFLDPLLAMAAAGDDVTVVGVSHPDPARAAPYGAQANAPVFTDHQDMCAKLRPDFAFALGRHCDMAEPARTLIASGIPSAMEKPCAISSAEAHDIAARASEAGLSIEGHALVTHARRRGKAAGRIAWSRPATCIPRPTRCSTCTTASGPIAITSPRRPAMRWRSSPMTAPAPPAA